MDCSIGIWIKTNKKRTWYVIIVYLTDETNNNSDDLALGYQKHFSSALCKKLEANKITGSSKGRAIKKTEEITLAYRQRYRYLTFQSNLLFIKKLFNRLDINSFISFKGKFATA